MKYPTNADEISVFNPRETIEKINAAGLELEAHQMMVLLMAWEKTLCAYHTALGSVDTQAAQRLHIVTHTITNIWGPKIQSRVPLPNRELAIKQQERDAVWHRRNYDSQ